MIPLYIATDGYLNSVLSIATRGYLQLFAISGATAFDAAGAMGATDKSSDDEDFIVLLAMIVSIIERDR